MANAAPTTDHPLDVPGATLRYDIQGEGPLLMLIPGGAADSTVFAPFVPHLVGDFTVVTFDPRGLSRSTITDPAGDIPIETQAADVHRLIEAVSDDPVAVFGSSGGAITALELATRHPNQVRALVVHEPPLVELLPDRDELKAAMDTLPGICRADGPEAATREFLRISGQFNRLDDDYVFPPRMRPAMEFFLEHMISPIIRYRPDPSALPELVIGVGTGTGELGHRGALALAELLGTATTQFPGGHAGFATHATTAAEALRGALSAVPDRPQ
jgi:pimeloyl-ACP methyl ester carboxylesterase